jgi:hypothetical protein
MTGNQATLSVFIKGSTETHKKPSLNDNPSGAGYQWSCLNIIYIFKKIEGRNNSLLPSFLPTAYCLQNCYPVRKALYLLGKSELTQEVCDKRHLISSSVGHLNRWWLS